MGISRPTARIIQENEVDIYTFHSLAGGEYGYGFSIYRIEEGKYRPLISTNLYAETSDEAHRDAENTIRKIRGLEVIKH